MDDHEQLISNMRARVEQCRRLAASINDAEARRILTEIAETGEADIKNLEAERQTG